MDRRLALVLTCAFAFALASPVTDTARAASEADRIEELQQELDSLIEEVDDLQAPVAEFELFEECMYLVGVSEDGARSGAAGYLYGSRRTSRGALAMDIGGFGRPDYHFLAFPAEEPPSIECNEDAGQEDTDED